MDQVPALIPGTGRPLQKGGLPESFRSCWVEPIFISKALSVFQAEASPLPTCHRTPLSEMEEDIDVPKPSGAAPVFTSALACRVSCPELLFQLLVYPHVSAQFLLQSLNPGLILPLAVC